MGTLLSYGIGVLAFLLLGYGMALCVQWAKRNREAAGALLAVAMLFGSSWVMPPPKPEFEEADKENADEDEEDDPENPD